MIGLIWASVMSSVEWNKKEELVTEQAIKHLKVKLHGSGEFTRWKVKVQRGWKAANVASCVSTQNLTFPVSFLSNTALF